MACIIAKTDSKNNAIIIAINMIIVIIISISLYFFYHQCIRVHSSGELVTMTVILEFAGILVELLPVRSL